MNSEPGATGSTRTEFSANMLAKQSWWMIGNGLDNALLEILKSSYVTRKPTVLLKQITLRFFFLIFTLHTCVCWIHFLKTMLGICHHKSAILTYLSEGIHQIYLSVCLIDSLLFSPRLKVDYKNINNNSDSIKHPINKQSNRTRITELENRTNRKLP